MLVEHAVDAKSLTQDAFVFDGISLAYVIHEHYAAQCLEAGVNATQLSIVAEDPWDETLRLFDQALTAIARSPLLHLSTSVQDIHSARDQGKLAVVLGTQGGGMVADQLWRVSVLWRLGLRCIGLAYAPGNLLADGCAEPRDAGLSFLGRDFVAAVNDLPMILDISHAGHRSRAEAVELARMPVCTHVNAHAVVPNDRNIRDETLRAIADKGSMVGVCAFPPIVKSASPTVSDLVAHIAHFVDIAGTDAVGIGLDFAEGYRNAQTQPDFSILWRTRRPDIFGTVDDFFDQSFPRGIESIDRLPNLTQALLDHGYQVDVVRRILGENWLRLFETAIG